jgi:hypothetical protein
MMALPPEAAGPLAPAPLGVRDAGHITITRLSVLYRSEASAADLASDLASVTSGFGALEAAMVVPAVPCASAASN